MMHTLTRNGHVQLTVPVVVQLGPELEQFRSEEFDAALKKLAAERLEPLLRALHVPGQPLVSVEAGVPGRAVRIRIHDTLQSFPPQLLWMAWLGSTSPSQRADVGQGEDRAAGGKGYPDRWLTAYLAALTREPGTLRLPVFFAELVRQVVAHRPSCLLPATCPDGTTGRAAHSARPATALSRPSIAAALLDLGAPLEDDLALLTDLPTGGRAEPLFERRRAIRIELHVHPGDLRLMTSPQTSIEADVWSYDESMPSELTARFKAFEVRQFRLRGFRLPPTYFVPNENVPSGLVAVKVNALLATPMPGVPPHFVTGGASGGRAREHDDTDRLSPRPSAGRDPVAFVGRRREKEAATAGSPAWVGEVVIPTLEWAVDEAPERLMGISDVEYLIAQLEAGFPDLVRATLAQFSIPQLTAVLRALVRERICIRDLRTILETLVEYEWVDSDPGDRLIFDERIVLPAGSVREVADDPAFRVEAVVRALALQLDQGLGGGSGELRVAGVQRTLEAQAEQAAIAPPARSASLRLPDAERERLLNDTWDATSGPEPFVVVTSAGARTTIRELLVQELSNITVLTREGLRPDRPTRSVGAIGEHLSPRLASATKSALDSPTGSAAALRRRL